MSYSGIYELSERQHNVLQQAANGQSIVFATLETNEQDSEHDRAELQACQHDSAELLRLGLVTDISSQFAEQIQLSRVNRKRGYQVYALTEQAIMLFHNCGERPLN